METDGKTNVSDVSLKAKNPAKEEIRVAASNPFDALCDGDSGDDIINSAVEKLKKVSVVSEPGNGKKAKKGKNVTQTIKQESNSVVTVNRSILKGGNGNYSNHNRANDQRGYYMYQNSGNGNGNGQRGYGQGSASNNYNNHPNGYYNGQRGYAQGGASNNYNNHHPNGYSNGQRGYGQGGVYNRQSNGPTSVQQNGNTTRQNGLYRANSGKMSSRSSNATEDGGSVKSDREKREEEYERNKKQRNEEFEQKLKSFKYDPKVEEEKRKFVATVRDTIAEKETAIEALNRQRRDNKDVDEGKLQRLKEERGKLLVAKNEAWEIIRLSEAKKLTLDDYEKMKEESKKASQPSKAEKRVIQSSDFDGLVVVAKKNVEDTLSLKPAVHKPVAKPKLEAEKPEQSKKMKKKKAELELMMSFFLPKPSDQDQAGDKNNGAAPSLESGGNFPGLRSASRP